MSGEYAGLYTPGHTGGKGWVAALTPDQKAWLEGLANFIADERGGMPPPWKEVRMALQAKYPDIVLPAADSTISKLVYKMMAARG